MEDTGHMQTREPIDDLVDKRPNGDFVLKLAIFQYTSAKPKFPRYVYLG
jgi:hypothetical protein